MAAYNRVRDHPFLSHHILIIDSLPQSTYTYRTIPLHLLIHTSPLTSDQNQPSDYLLQPSPPPNHPSCHPACPCFPSEASGRTSFTQDFNVSTYHSHNRQQQQSSQNIAAFLESTTERCRGWKVSSTRRNGKKTDLSRSLVRRRITLRLRPDRDEALLAVLRGLGSAELGRHGSAGNHGEKAGAVGEAG